MRNAMVIYFFKWNDIFFSAQLSAFYGCLHTPKILFRSVEQQKRKKIKMKKINFVSLVLKVNGNYK